MKTKFYSGEIARQILIAIQNEKNARNTGVSNYFLDENNHGAKTQQSKESSR